MTLPKLTYDKSVNYIPKSEQTRKIKQKTIKNLSTPREQTKNISQNNKNFLINGAAKDLVSLNE